MKIDGKTFVVTGGGGGIGGELVLELLKRGARVTALDLKADGVEAVKSRAGENADKMTIHTIDITDREAVSKLPDEIIAEHGQIDGVINCAGIIQPFVKVNDLDFEAIERVMNVNFYGTLNMVKAFLPHLLKRPSAHLVNVSSMGGFLPVPGQSIYGASKAAVKLMTEGLYAELANTNVDVSVVFPGATETEITKNSGLESPAADEKEASKHKTLPADVAARLIVNGIESGKLYIYTGSDSNMMNKLYRLNPQFATNLIAKQMKSLLDQ